MSTSTPGSTGVLESDIRAQADAYAHVVDEGPPRWDPMLERPFARAIERVVLTGMGSSFFAARAAEHLLTARGMDAKARLSSELLHFGPRLEPGDLLVAVTQSGESVEVVRLLQRAADSGASTIVVTLEEMSPAAAMADAAMLLGVPEDHGVAIKTFGASYLALSYLSARITGGAGSWRESADQAARAVRATAEAAPRQLGTDLGGRATTMVTLARGPLGPGAQEAALLVNEVSKVPAWAEESGQFRHGIIELAGPEVTIALLVGDGADGDMQIGLASELKRTGAIVLATAPEHLADRLTDAGARVIPVPEADTAYAPLIHVIPFQWMALGWAEARGVEPGRFRHAQEVVRSEAGSPLP